MNSHLNMKYDKSQMGEYMIELLTLGVCDLFLRAGFVEEEGHLLASYQTEGFRPLSSVAEISTGEIFNVILRLYRGIYQCEKHCLFAELFQTDPAWIFTDQDYSRVKMVFSPSQERLPLAEQMVRVIEFLREKTKEEGRGYADRACELILHNEYGYRALIHHLENLQREVYLCGIK